MILQNCKEK